MSEPIVPTEKITDLLGITPAECTPLKKCGALIPAAGRGRWLLRSTIRAYTAHLRRLVDARSSDAAELQKELTKEKILKTRAEAALAELRLAEGQGRLVAAAEVTESGVRIGAMLTAKIAALVNDSCGTLAGLDEQGIRDRLHARTQQLLEDIKNELGKL